MRSQEFVGIARFRRKAAALVAALALVVGLSVVAATPAMAAGCDGHGCVGLDPVQQGCTVTSTTSSPVSVWQSGRYVQVATVWNRYSWYCHANWARGQLTSAGINAGYGIFAQINDSYGDAMCYPTGATYPVGQYPPTQEDCSNSPYRGSLAIYSDMVDGTAGTTATVLVYDSNGSFVTKGSVDQ